MNIQHTFIRARKSFFVGKIGLFSVVRITSNVRPFQSTPKTLAAEKGATSSAQSTTMRFFQRFVFGNQYGLVAHKLYEKTVAQAERNDLWKGCLCFYFSYPLALQLTPSFHNWFEVTLLHVWMTVVRLRLEGTFRWNIM